MWYGKNDNRWDEEVVTPVVVTKPVTIDDIKHALAMAKLKADLENYFNQLGFEE